MSFLQRLKSKDVVPATPTDERAEKVEEQKKVAVKAAVQANQVVDQLKVDIYQTANAILVYAPLAGAGIDNYAVTIEGENDIVTIKGERARPSGDYFQHGGTEEMEQVLSECMWGSFYRQIILPAEVDATKAEAKSVNGVLILYLPLLQMSQKGVRINVTTV